MFLDQGPITMSRASSSSIVLQVCCSGRAGACGRGPSASIRRRPRRSASTSSGCATGTSSSAASSPASRARYLTLEATGSFQNGMTAGRGFIALAAMIFGRWTPIGAFGGGAALRVLGRARAGDPLRAADRPARRHPVGPIPPQFFGALPYLVTIIVLAGVVGRSIPPAADGQPYEQRGRRPDDGRRDAGRERAPAVARRRPRPRRRAAGRSRSSTTTAIARGPAADAAGSRSSARRRTRAGRRSASSATSSTRATSASRSTRTSATSSAIPAFRTARRGGRRRPARSTSSTSSAARSCASPHARRRSRPARAACGSSSASSTGRPPGSPTTAGLAVVMDRCTAIEHRRLRGR